MLETIMIILNPCNCGGLPYSHSIIYPTAYGDDELWLVRCMRCGNVGMLENTEIEAINSWNKGNNYELKKSILTIEDADEEETET